METDVLLAGAGGALGQVLGAHLRAAGLSVDALVRPARAEEARAGWTLWRVRHGRAPRAVRFEPSGVLTEPAEARDRTYRIVLLAVSSDDLRAPWVGELADATGHAPFAALGQASGDRAAVEAAAGSARTVLLIPGLLAWSAPLRDETPAAGIAYWLPPLAPRLVGGAPGPARAVARTLRHAGLRGVRFAGTPRLGVAIARRTIPLMAELERAGWSLERLRRAQSPPLRAGLALAPHLVPFDLEAYLQRHFTKVGEQTRLMLREWEV